MACFYFDWAASAPCDPQAAETLAAALTRYPGNPSAQHAPGKEARAALESCRSRCAAFFGVMPQTLIFTSGGSESNNLVLSSFLRKRQPIAILSSPIEHPSVLNPLFELKKAGHHLDFLKLNSDGTVCLDDLRRKLSPSLALVCLIHTHNESGCRQPIAETSKLIRQFEAETGSRIHLHCDAVQSAGKSAPDWLETDVDSASVSAHKFGGPRGTGILYLKKPIEPLYVGGGQERNLRPGTENLPGIAAMTEALQLRAQNRDAETAQAYAVQNRLAQAFTENPFIEMPFFNPNNKENECCFSPYLLSIAVPGLPSEVTQRLLNDRGFAVSPGSACSANAEANKQKIKNPFNLDKKSAASLIRLSWGHSTTLDEVDALIQAIEQIIEENSFLLRQKK